jgi:hypothetical protein
MMRLNRGHTEVSNGAFLQEAFATRGPCKHELFYQNRRVYPKQIGTLTRGLPERAAIVVGTGWENTGGLSMGTGWEDACVTQAWCLGR